jgi:hypothetical protein
MKKLFFLLFIIAPLCTTAQFITADPALEPMKVTTIDNDAITVTQLPLGQVIKLKVPILNKNVTSNIPSGTCKVKIGLGSKIGLDPTFDLTTVNTSTYFNWTAVASGGQVQITGELIADLPANFSDTAYFDIKGIILGSSTITTNFLVTNHNTTLFLSDENGANNTAATAYTIITNVTVPLNLIDFNARIENCKPILRWITDNELNTSHFDIERATIGNDWTKIVAVGAQGNSATPFNYSFTDNNTATLPNKLFYRLKMVDLNGAARYTPILAVFNNCSKVELLVYPNPVISRKLSFSINGFSANAVANLKSSTGETLRTTKVKNGTNYIVVDGIANGVYMLTVHDGNSFYKQSKVIIQN